MKKILSLLLTLAMVLSLVACGKQQTVEQGKTDADESIAPVELQEEEPEEEIEPAGFYNPLTGEATETDLSNNRPIAVMLNSVWQALPQSGNSQADILYEMPEEGGATRIMGLYQDISGVGKLGTVRSTRPYYVRLALGADAILVHCGGSNRAYEVIKMYMENCDFTDIDYLNKGTNMQPSLYYRDEFRLNSGFATEHTLYTNSDLIQAYLEENPDNLRLTHTEEYQEGHTFVEDGTPANGEDASKIEVVFSGYKHTVFDYDEENGVYNVRMVYPQKGYDWEYEDESNGQQVAVENVIVVQTTMEELNDSKGHVLFYLTGTGSGFYACNGKVEKITWVKDDVEELYTFFDEEGNELSLGVGKSFVCVLDKSCKILVDDVEQEKPADAGENVDLAGMDALDDDNAD